MPSLVSTAELVREGRRFDGAEAFFGRFSPAWASVQREVWKLETRQTYEEPGNPSWERLAQGDFEGAVRLIPSVREADLALYASLAARKVRFLRCRPVSQPLAPYLRWEIEVYKFNAAHGEEIFFFDAAAAADPPIRFAEHDFMIFDDRVAFVHDYDAAGSIQGGWELTSPDAIAELRALYQELLGRSTPFREFLATHGA
jgi:hypothetical protein